ncbi:MAG: DUF72 domain-containing protein, partial [Candidatus Limnocylindrales bacterium]
MHSSASHESARRHSAPIGEWRTALAAIGQQDPWSGAEAASSNWWAAWRGVSTRWVGAQGSRPETRANRRARLALGLAYRVALGLAYRTRIGQPGTMPSLPRQDAASTNPHDPGPDAAGDRVVAVAQAASEPLVTPRGSSIRIGTASWTDPTMTAPGVFYPRGTDSAEERLAYYAATFPIVEIDATYYALP